MLVDTHCHLGDPAFDADRPEVVSRATAGGVGHIVVVADSLATTQQAATLAEAHGLSATAGVHPHEASSWSQETAELITAALGHPAVVAVGETGLDYHYDHAPRPIQREVFEAQLAIAAQTGIPVVVHARDADHDMAAMIRNWGGQVPAIVLHSFSSGPTVFEAGLEVGAYFGWSGMVTFKKWSLDDLLLACPTDRLLVETDGPYLAPVPHRGKRNEPAFVRLVAERIAEARTVSFEEMAEISTSNAARCFGSRVTQSHTKS